VLAAGICVADLTGAAVRAQPAKTAAAPLEANGAAGMASAGKSKVRYTHAYAVLVQASNTLILVCLDKALTAADLAKVAAYARRETTGVFKHGLSTASTPILELTLPFKPGTTAAALTALGGFDLSLANDPADWTYRFPTDPALLKMNASVSGNTARLVRLAGELKAGGRVQGQLTGSGKDPREDPPTPLAWDVAFDAVVTVAR
jgi:hypothetical protein